MPFPMLIYDDVCSGLFPVAWSLSYLIVRPENERGNVMIDSPRFASQLVKRIAALGGSIDAATHRDDIANHERSSQKFGTSESCMPPMVRAGWELERF